MGEWSHQTLVDPAGPDLAQMAGRQHRTLWRWTGAIVALALAAGGVAMWITSGRTSSGVPACSAVTRVMLDRALGANLSEGVPGRANGGESEDLPVGATDCSYGRLPGLAISVVAFRQRADSFYSQVLKAVSSKNLKPFIISGPQYKAFVVPVSPGAQWQTQGFYLVKHGQYVSALILQAPRGAAQALAVATANNLR
jgi:hypothetical protein